MHDYPDDPAARPFDRLLALTAYGLLVFSVFTLWVPALIAAAIAFTHRRGADTLIASHFRFQLTIFWGSIVLVALAVAAFVVAGGFAVGALFSAMPGLSWGMVGQAMAMGPAGTALLLTMGGLGLLALATVWTLVAALWGALRLVSDRPMGQSGAGRDLEIR